MIIVLFSCDRSLVASAAPLLKKHSQRVVWWKLVMVLLVSNFWMWLWSAKPWTKGKGN